MENTKKMFNNVIKELEQARTSKMWSFYFDGVSRGEEEGRGYVSGRYVTMSDIHDIGGYVKVNKMTVDFYACVEEGSERGPVTNSVTLDDVFVYKGSGSFVFLYNVSDNKQVYDQHIHCASTMCGPLSGYHNSGWLCVEWSDMEYIIVKDGDDNIICDYNDWQMSSVYTSKFGGSVKRKRTIGN